MTQNNDGIDFRTDVFVARPRDLQVGDLYAAANIVEPQFKVIQDEISKGAVPTRSLRIQAVARPEWSDWVTPGNHDDTTVRIWRRVPVTEPTPQPESNYRRVVVTFMDYTVTKPMEVDETKVHQSGALEMYRDGKLAMMFSPMSWRMTCDIDLALVSQPDSEETGDLPLQTTYSSLRKGDIYNHGDTQITDVIRPTYTTAEFLITSEPVTYEHRTSFTIAYIDNGQVQHKDVQYADTQMAKVILRNQTEEDFVR